MIDSGTRERIRVYAEQTAWPYVMVPLDQLDEIKVTLMGNDVEFWVDSHSVALNEHPAVVVINFARGTDACRVQKLLDDVD